MKKRKQRHQSNVWPYRQTDIDFGALHLLLLFLFITNIIIIIINNLSQISYIYLYPQFMSIIYGHTSWPYFMAILHGYISWPYFMAIFHGHTSWLYFMAILHGYISWLYFMAILHGYISWPYFMAIICFARYKGDKKPKIPTHVSLSVEQREYLKENFGGYSTGVGELIIFHKENNPKQLELMEKQLEKELAEFRKKKEIVMQEEQEKEMVRAEGERHVRDKEIAENKKLLLDNVKYWYGESEEEREDKDILKRFVIGSMDKLKDFGVDPMEFLKENESEEGVTDLLNFLKADKERNMEHGHG